MKKVSFKSGIIGCSCLLVINVLLSFGFALSATAAVTPQVAAGDYHTIELKSDGTVVAWGDNGYGQLGDGSTTRRLAPTPVPGLNGVTAIAVGWHHTVALMSDGTVVAWGNNGYGQLGDNSTTSSLTPTPVPGLSGVTAIAAGGRHTVALKSDGTLVAWGDNGEGQIGDGNTTTFSRLTPTPVAGKLRGVTAIAAGGAHTVALKSDGSVVAWGRNGVGQLGDGSTTNRRDPISVPGLSGVTAIAAGGYHTAALKNDGTTVAWGDYSYGLRNDGSSIRCLAPAPVVVAEKPVNASSSLSARLQ